MTIAIDCPYSELDAPSSASTSRPVRESRLPVGSSAKISSGREPSARAIATRCCCPPESSCGRCRSRSRRPSESMSWSIHCRSVVEGLRPSSSNGSRMLPSMSSVGTRLNDWNTNPTRRRRIIVSSVSSSRRDLGVAEPHPPARSGVEPGHDVHERRLARAARSHDRGELTAAQADREVVEGGDRCARGAVELAEVGDAGHEAHVAVVVDDCHASKPRPMDAAARRPRDWKRSALQDDAACPRRRPPAGARARTPRAARDRAATASRARGSRGSSRSPRSRTGPSRSRRC